MPVYANSNITYGYFIRCFILLSLVSWFITMNTYAYNYCRIVLLETYWNLERDDAKFYDKIRNIINDINPAILMLENDRLDEIYIAMNSVEKSVFRINVFQNGLKPRIKKIIANYR